MAKNKKPHNYVKLPAPATKGIGWPWVITFVVGSGYTGYCFGRCRTKEQYEAEVQRLKQRVEDAINDYSK